MVNMFSNNALISPVLGALATFRRLCGGSGLAEGQAARPAHARAWESALLAFANLAFLALFGFVAAEAMAQVGSDGAGGLCEIAKWLKNIAATAAIIALILYVFNSFFSKSSIIGDIIMYVVIGCVIVTAATFIIQKTGLTVSCSL